jgi:hypothetical protein
VEAATIDRAPGSMVAAPELGRDPRSAARQRRARERMAQAEVVVAGLVESVQLPSAALKAATRAVLAPRPPSPPVSEHDPEWREAVVRVERVHKGAHGGGRVVVRFAASQDVRWFRAPKFQAGQQGVFALHGPDEEQAPRPARAARGLAPAKGRAYTAVDPADVQPLESQQEVARLFAPPVPSSSTPRPAAGARRAPPRRRRRKAVR